MLKPAPCAISFHLCCLCATVIKKMSANTIEWPVGVVENQSVVFFDDTILDNQAGALEHLASKKDLFIRSGAILGGT